jgi:hypothetical protein
MSSPTLESRFPGLTAFVARWHARGVPTSEIVTR